MPTTTTTYSFNKPVVGADEDDWGGYLNGNWDSVDNLLDGTTPVTGIDINSGTIDGVVIGGSSAAAGTFTTLTANTSITGTLATAAQPNVTSLGTLTGLTVSGSTSLAGASTSADITFGDNDKAIFGAGSDLQIYHDGSRSIIQDNGTGNLRIQANNLELNNADNSENYLFAANNGAVTLYYDNAEKLATTSTGVDITGTAVTDGVTSSGNIEIAKDSPQILWNDTAGGTQVDYSAYANGGAFAITDVPNSYNLLTLNSGSVSLAYQSTAKLATTSTGVDITGTLTSDGLTVDGDLRINTTSGKLTYVNDIAGWTVDMEDGTSDLYIRSGVASPTDRLKIEGNGDISFYEDTGTTAKFFWDASAESLGIGTSSPDELLHIHGATQSYIKLTDDDSGQGATDGALFAFDGSSATQYIWNYENGPTVFATNGSERMRIDTSGNLLVGRTTTPPTAGAKIALASTGDTAVQITKDGVVAGRVMAVTTGLAFGVDGSDGATERMRIDGSGTVRIGGQTGTLKLGNDATYHADIEWEYNNNELAFTANNTANFTFNSNGSERMRIDSSGKLLVGTTSSNSTGLIQGRHNTGAGNAVLTTWNEANSGTRFHMQFLDSSSGSDRGSITTNGSSTSFNTTSDYRLKENVVELTGATDRLKQLGPKRFNFTVDAGTTVDGFLAHEVQSVVPEAVTGTKDAMRDEEYEVTPAVLDDDGNVVTEAVMGTRSVPDYQGIDQAKLVPLLTAALQEAIAKIETLETKVAALEGA